MPAALALGVPQAAVGLVLGVLLVGAITVEVTRRRSSRAGATFYRAFAPLLRARESHAVTGATWLLVAMTAALVLLPRESAIAATWAAAVGDAAAALVGMRWGRHRRANGKSIEGSAACALTTMLGVLLLTQLPFAAAAVCGLVAAIAEQLSWPEDDNARITALVGVAALAWRAAPY